MKAQQQLMSAMQEQLEQLENRILFATLLNELFLHHT